METPDPGPACYRIIRMYQRADVRHRVIARGLTLAEARTRGMRQ